MREIILDTETTGLDYKTGDRIIEVGCVELINHIPSGNNLQFYCSTDKKITNNAINIHGLTNNFLKNHPTFKEQSKKFLDFIKSDILIIHNADFDVGFINNELKLIGANSNHSRVVVLSRTLKPSRTNVLSNDRQAVAMVLQLLISPPPSNEGGNMSRNSPGTSDRGHHLTCGHRRCAKFLFQRLLGISVR